MKRVLTQGIRNLQQQRDALKVENARLAKEKADLRNTLDTAHSLISQLETNIDSLEGKLQTAM